MRSSQPLRSDEPASVSADLAHYWRAGYAVVRGFFDTDEVAELAAAIHQIEGEGVAHGHSFRHGHLFYNIAKDANGGPLVRMVQWPSYHQSVLNRARLDTRFAQLLEPL